LPKTLSLISFFNSILLYLKLTTLHLKSNYLSPYLVDFGCKIPTLGAETTKGAKLKKGALHPKSRFSPTLGAEW
jgi:hypothetical protein